MVHQQRNLRWRGEEMREWERQISRGFSCEVCGALALVELMEEAWCHKAAQLCLAVLVSQVHNMQMPSLHT